MRHKPHKVFFTGGSFYTIPIGVHIKWHFKFSVFREYWKRWNIRITRLKILNQWQCYTDALDLVTLRIFFPLLNNTGRKEPLFRQNNWARHKSVLLFWVGVIEMMKSGGFYPYTLPFLGAEKAGKYTPICKYVLNFCARQVKWCFLLVAVSGYCWLSCPPQK